MERDILISNKFPDLASKKYCLTWIFFSISWLYNKNS